MGALAFPKARRLLLSWAMAGAMVCGASTPEPVDGIFEEAMAVVPEGDLDKIVFEDLGRLGIHPVLCSDAVFVRRAFLDVIGVLPTAQEARAFIEDPDASHKRADLVEHLLGRPEFADYWAMRWGDVLRIKAEFPINLWPNGAQAYHRWVRASIAANMPYDRFVREMLTASGSNFRVGAVNFYRAVQNRTPEGIAGAVALTFMGARVDSWPTNRLADMAVFFARIGYKPTEEWKEEHVFWDYMGGSAVEGNSAPGHASVAEFGQSPNTVAQPAVSWLTNRPPEEAILPDGRKVRLPADRDPREIFADWLIRPENPWFARCAANRVWAWLLGRGIIDEPDDIREDNPPSNPALLAYLERQFISSGYDLKQLYRLILTSRTYQLSSVPRQTTTEAAARFASYRPRRLDAEVLIDAINQVTGTSDLYTSPIPEPYTYIPEGMRAVSIADGSITSPFLALFGRSARATGMSNERDNQVLPAQWLHLLNSSHIQRKLEQGPGLKAIWSSRREEAEIVEELYLTILSRFPSPRERAVVEAYGTAAGGGAADKTGRLKRREAWLDIAWALINSTEFVFRH